MFLFFDAFIIFCVGVQSLPKLSHVLAIVWEIFLGVMIDCTSDVGELLTQHDLFNGENAALFFDAAIASDG